MTSSAAVPRTPPPPIAAVVGFIDCINRGDLDGLTRLMHADHRLVVLDEDPLVGRDANRDAWRGYFTSFPEYVIHPRFLRATGEHVVVLGATTGSHLGLPDDEELTVGVVWLAEVHDGLLRSWQVAADTPETRARCGIPAGL